MKRKLLIILFFIPAALFSFELDPGIAPDFDPSGLDAKAQRAGFFMKEYSKDGVPHLHAESDYHAAVQLPLNSLAEILSDYENHDLVFSRIISTEDLEPEAGSFERHRQKVHNSAKFLGIGEEYIYINNIAVERYDEDEFFLHWMLERCLKGNFTAHEGFWYLKSLEAEEESPVTYIRMKAETVFENPLPFQELVMNLFTDSETSKVFKELYIAAAE